jgi:hypothetical protein
VVQLAKEFLAAVFEDEEADVSDRLDATALTRKFEAAKVMPQTVHLTRRDEIDRKEAWRKHEIEQRRWRLIMATHQIPPRGYADDLKSPDYLPPPGDHWPPGSDRSSGRLKLVYDRERDRG